LYKITKFPDRLDSLKEMRIISEPHYFLFLSLSSSPALPVINAFFPIKLKEKNHCSELHHIYCSGPGDEEINS